MFGRFGNQQIKALSFFARAFNELGRKFARARRRLKALPKETEGTARFSAGHVNCTTPARQIRVLVVVT